MTQKPRLICLGAFAAAHGVKGAIKIKAFTEDPRDVASYGAVRSEDGTRRFTLTILREVANGCVLATAPEIESREDAKTLSGMKLFVAREALPSLDDEDDFYTEDLVGLKALSEDGTPLGAVSAVFDFGAGDLLELKHIPGVKGAKLVPFTKEAVPEIDMAGGVVTIADAFSPLHEDHTIDEEERQHQASANNQQQQTRD